MEADSPGNLRSGAVVLHQVKDVGRKVVARSKDVLRPLAQIDVLERAALIAGDHEADERWIFPGQAVHEDFRLCALVHG